MSEISVFGAGAFGTALAISLARAGKNVQLIARNQERADILRTANENTARLAGVRFPDTLVVTSDTSDPALICMLAVPTQELSRFVQGISQEFVGRTLVACCKGVDRTTGLGPTGVILNKCPMSEAAVLSGPGFAIDIAAGLPTALTIAARSDVTARFLQEALSTKVLRLYRSTDIFGVELGGALKNIMAIAAGITIGAGLGESARAALMARGFEELGRFAQSAGANPTTLAGLSGLGDLVLTCTSEKSRNFAFGIGLGQGAKADTSITVEGMSTAIAVADLARARNIEMPITFAVAALLSGKISTKEAVKMLLSRPLKKE
ncbi:MAG: NAD(P)H-dependent glycerol-3-phosphate dehydrogenase [Paracoccaceae bacterium]